MEDTPGFRPARERWGMIERDQTPATSIGKHLVVPLRDWCLARQIVIQPLSWYERSRFEDEPEAGRLTDHGVMMCAELRIVANNEEELKRAVDADNDLLIDMVDWLVNRALSPLDLEQRRKAASPEFDDDSGQSRVGRSRFPSLRQLDQWLSVGGSAWTVDADGACLTQRVSVELRETYVAATEADDDASKYLRAGWKAAWGVSPSSDLAHENAVNALEALFRSVVTPDESDATLGKIVSVLRDRPSKWRARLEDLRSPDNKSRTSDAGVLFVEAALRVVFQSDYRHAKAKGASEHTDEDGRDAVTIAAALIALQRRGFLEWRETRDDS